MQSCMSDGSQTWPVNRENEMAHQRTEIRMITRVDGCVVTK